ncbi:MAG: hypothetical protein ABIP36_04125 [Acidimicrobiales bacterium]
MATRPPADAIVALRSMGRRWRGVFAGLGDDEQPDDLANRIGGGGRSAFDHLMDATRTTSLLSRALQQTLTEADPSLHPAVSDPTARQWEHGHGGDVEAGIAELAQTADGLADRAGRVSASEWARDAPVAGGAPATNALAILWDAVDSAVEHLRSAERVLQEVRGR